MEVDEILRYLFIINIYKRLFCLNISFCYLVESNGLSFGKYFKN